MFEQAKSRRCKIPSLYALEARLAPANNIAVVNSQSSTNVSSQFDQQTGTFVFSTTGPSAQLDIDEIEAALKQQGVTGVRIVTDVGGNGIDGNEAGNIVWDAGAVGRQLNDQGSTLRTLELRPAANSGGDIVLASTIFGVGPNQFSGLLNLVFNTSTSAGDIAFSSSQNQSGVAFGSAIQDLTVNAGGTFTYANGPNAAASVTGSIQATASSMLLSHGGFTAGTSISISAGSLQLGAMSIQAGDQVHISGSTTLLGDLQIETFGEVGLVHVKGQVIGQQSLTIASTHIEFQQATVGDTIPLSIIALERGTLSLNGSTVHAGNLVLGSGNASGDAILAEVSGILDADVTVRPRGRVSPGGPNVAGTMTIAGSVNFDGGSFDVDLGVNSDQLDVQGMLFGNQGGFLAGHGALTGPANVVIIKYSGQSAGQFTNAPLGVPFVLGFDAVQVTSYGTVQDPNVTIARVAAATGGIVTAVEDDGTGVTAKLKGPGELVSVNGVGGLSLAARGTTLASTITITTKANTSNAIADFDQIVANGPLKSLTAKSANIANGLQVDGTIQTIAVRDIGLGGIELGGAPADKSALSTRNLLGSVISAGTLSLTVKGDMAGTLNAAAIGTARVSANLSGNWNVAGAITSLAAGRIVNLALNALYLETMAVGGSVPLGLAGEVIDSTFRLTGNSGTALGSYGLKAVKVTGNVVGSTFDVEEGNVGKFTVGRFRNSRLVLDYTPDASFNNTGTFDSSGVFTLGSFKTTAATLNAPGGVSRYACVGSTIAADTIQKVVLSGLQIGNGGVSFGIKSRSNHGSIRVKSTDGNLPLNTNLQPSLAAVAGDFFVVDV